MRFINDYHDDQGYIHAVSGNSQALDPIGERSHLCFLSRHSGLIRTKGDPYQRQTETRLGWSRAASG